MATLTVKHEHLLLPGQLKLSQRMSEEAVSNENKSSEAVNAGTLYK